MLREDSYSTLETPAASSSGIKRGHAAPVFVKFVPPLVVGLIAAWADTTVRPYERAVSEYVDGPAISHPRVPATVTTNELYIYAWLLPLAAIAAFCALVRDLQIFLVAALGLLEASVITLVLTTFGKKTAGSLRPNFFALCGWNGTDCTGPEELVMSARQSFPSGHASLSGAGLTFLSLFFLFVAKKYLRRDAYYEIMLSVTRLALMLPVMFAIWIAITRTIDYYHRFEDIGAGLFLGVGVAFATASYHLRDEGKEE